MVTRRQVAGRRLGALEAEVMDYAWVDPSRRDAGLRPRAFSLAI
jgi:hypothetical protein